MHPDFCWEPLPLECLLNQKIGRWRIILRVSLQQKDETYLPLSFVCHTPDAFAVLLKGGRILEDRLAMLT
jgi:hypothetical protein